MMDRVPGLGEHNIEIFAEDVAKRRLRSMVIRPYYTFCATTLVFTAQSSAAVWSGQEKVVPNDDGKTH
jgi:hypothetical protein